MRKLSSIAFSLALVMSIIICFLGLVFFVTFLFGSVNSKVCRTP